MTFVAKGPPLCHPDRPIYARRMCKRCYSKATTTPAMRRRWVLARYDLTPEAFEAMATRQNGKCPICLKRAALVIDHDHETGTVRGLLCGRCNSALGFFADDWERFDRAVQYLAGKR